MLYREYLLCGDLASNIQNLVKLHTYNHYKITTFYKLAKTSTLTWRIFAQLVTVACAPTGKKSYSTKYRCKLKPLESGHLLSFMP